MKRMENLNEKVQRLMAERQNYDLQFTDSKEQLINAKEELHAAKEEC
jgi:predicted  nucleic acid-binding Zn-ribbon protein